MAFLNEEGLARLWSHIISKLNNKVEKEEGKKLSSNDYTDADKQKLESLEEGVVINLTGDVVTDTVLTNADLLGGIAASEYATVDYVDNKAPSGSYAAMKRINAAVLASRWEQSDSKEYTQLIEVEDMSPLSKCYHIDVDTTDITKDNALAIKIAWSYVDRAETVTDGILLTAFADVPTVDFNIIADVETIVTDIPNVAGVNF